MMQNNLNHLPKHLSIGTSEDLPELLKVLSLTPTVFKKGAE